tara:strand:+ start:19836 stop:23867 length:4032 start_codon:yes stop_codon:yes gene_type:complete
MSYDYTSGYNYNNYPEIRKESLESGDIDFGHVKNDTTGDNAMPIKWDQHDNMEKPRARFNRAHMNVDQYNYLAGRVNSIAKVRPHTFNDYYEMYPYTSGELIVPTGLYSVEFRIDQPSAEKWQCIADNLAEAKGRLLKTAVTAPWSSKQLYLSESGGVITCEDEIVYYEQLQKDGGAKFKENGGATEKDYLFNFLVMSHQTGWSVKRNHRGYEEWEDVNWLKADAGGVTYSFFEERFEPLSGEAEDPRTFDGSKVIGVAQRLGIPIKNHNDLPDNYVTEMEKHGTDLSVKTNVYDIEAEKTQFPVRNGSDSLAPDTAFGSWYKKDHYKIRGTMGRLKSDFGSTELSKFGEAAGGSAGYATSQVWYESGSAGKEISPSTNMEVFLSHTKTFTLNTQLATTRDVRAYAGYKQSGTHWDSNDHRPPDYTFAGTGRVYGICTGFDANDTTNKIAQHQGYANASKYMFLDRMPDYLMNHHYRASWGYGNADSILDANRWNAFVWSDSFYTNNDHYIERGYGAWRKKYDIPQTWQRTWPGYLGYGASLDKNFSYIDILTGCSDAAGLSCVDDNHSKNHAWKNILFGWQVGYNTGEVYDKSILRARHLMINKRQSERYSFATYKDVMALTSDSEVEKRFSEIQDHTETYDFLPYPAQKNTSYGVVNPTGGGSLKVDPNYLNDPFNRITSTDWVSVEDVKAKAEELGFLFEFRRLAVPFKLQQFDFTVGAAKGLIRPSGIVNYQKDDGDGRMPLSGHPDIATTQGNAGLDNSYYFYSGVKTPAHAESTVTKRITKLYQQWPVPNDSANTYRNPWPIVNGDSKDTAFATAKQHINNIRNGIYWDNYSTSNPVYWIGGSNTSHLGGGGLSNDDDGTNAQSIWPDSETFWCRGADCNACVDYRNVFGGDNYQGGGCADGDSDDLGDCFECTAAEKLDGTCIECPRFSGKLSTDDYKLLKLEGDANDGEFSFTTTGYTPFVSSMKTFIWADNKSETNWVKPVGLGTRHIYRYRTDDFYELYKTDRVKEQFVHPNSSNPYRAETVSSWLGNYIHFRDEKPWQGNNTISSPMSGSSYGTSWGSGFGSVVMPNAQAIVNRAKRSVYPWGASDGYNVDHYKIVWHLGLLNYSTQPLLPITVDSNSVEYKAWMLNIQERLFPKHYIFQDASHTGWAGNGSLQSGHASFAYIEPDVQYGDFNVSTFTAENAPTSTGQFVFESGMMTSSLDLFDGTDGNETDESWLGVNNYQISDADGASKSPLLWQVGQGIYASEQQTFVKDNSVPSIYTDFMPKQEQHVSGGCWGKITNQQFLDYQGTLQGYDPPRGTKIALQFYVNNTLDRTAGELREAGPDTLTCWQH